MLETNVTRLLRIKYPIIQAPMAGGPTTPGLVAAVSNAGGLGSLGAGYLAPEQVRSAIREIRQLTDRPFGVNLFVPEESRASDETISKMNEVLNGYREKLGIDANPAIPKYSESFEEQAEVLLEENVPVFSFTFGIPSAKRLEAMRQQGIVLVGTATTVDEAMKLEAAGVHAITAQGSEAGGHRGTFLKKAEESLIGTMALVPQMVDLVSVPVIASGGIMDGRGLVASLALGASAVQMGTAFLACSESGAHTAFKQKILTANEDSTEITSVYSGKAARGIRTEFMREMEAYTSDIPEYPIQNALTRDIRQAAARANNPEYMSLWAGQGLRLAGERTAAETVEVVIKQAEELVSLMGKLGGKRS
ncbi:nitronate monooxygenase family protein [Paenibacillus sp. OV219]|uniref:NAD(P)H-dependent flavin oxidoreductase n=1 Tax=Paenibacillus sp. OV219 TaxID=1884377 RepID=UPI0008BCBBF1|nr:nitronate monooxygenase [Paenibacillus sp. OV219]SEN36128.1 nitronate monooxygenase [Paenibacillus sp. OV219]